MLLACVQATFFVASGVRAIRSLTGSPLSSNAFIVAILALTLVGTLFLSSAAAAEAVWPLVTPSWASRLLYAPDPPAASPPPLHSRLGWRFTLCCFCCFSFALNALDSAEPTLASFWDQYLGKL